MAEAASRMHGARISPHLVGGADPVDPTVTKHSDPVGQGKRLVVVVGDVQCGQAEPPQQHAQLDGQPLAQRPVQRAQRLVQH